MKVKVYHLLIAFAAFGGMCAAFPRVIGPIAHPYNIAGEGIVYLMHAPVYSKITAKPQPTVTLSWLKQAAERTLKLQRESM